MVFAQLLGGIGNQLFITATALSLSLDLDESLNLSVNTVSCTPRKPHFDTFLQGIQKGPLKGTLYREKGLWKANCFAYEPIPLQKNLKLFGQFSSYKYFEHHRKEIVKQFTKWCRPKVDYLCKKYGIGETTTIALHVRRGDYLNFPDKHPFLGDTDYYEKALQKIAPGKVIVFSDDIEWCKSKWCNVTFVEDGSPDEQLMMMSRSTHNIIANSTFSWWGAYLGNREGRQVICPKNFSIYVKENKLQDLYPPSWIII